jgi:hypothetical protein
VRLFVCPGVHEPALTQQFLQALSNLPDFHWVTDLPQERCIVLPGGPAALAIPLVLAQLQAQMQAPSPEPLAIIAFSAGVVGIAAALTWLQCQGLSHRLPLHCLIAIDGWGVPLIGLPCPVYRLSHDAWTDGCILPWERCQPHFYADPAVDHCELWRLPQTAWGWYVDRQGRHQYTNALAFIDKCLR